MKKFHGQKTLYTVVIVIVKNHTKKKTYLNNYFFTGLHEDNLHILVSMCLFFICMATFTNSPTATQAKL